MSIPVETASLQFCTCDYVIQFHTVCVFYILISIMQLHFYIHTHTFVCVSVCVILARFSVQLMTLILIKYA